MLHAQAALLAEQQLELATWARSVVAKADSHPILQSTQTVSINGDRLQTFGYGDTDPVAPNSPAGQPLNRRVVVVIDPAVST